MTDRAGVSISCARTCIGWRASGCSCSRRRIVRTGGRQTDLATINTRCRVPISISCRNGRRWSAKRMETVEGITDVSI